MELKKIYELADGLAPFALSKEYCETYGMRDNSGVQLDCGGDISAVLFALDLSKDAVKRAQDIGARCIFTHHPAIFDPLYSITEETCASLLACAKAGISVISSHLSLDTAAGGIDDSMMQGLGGTQAEAVMHTLSRGGYGKVCSVSPCTLGAFAEHVGKAFLTSRIVTYGNGTVKRVASFCGAGMDEQTVAFAAREGADTVVTSDGKHHLIVDCVERGMNVVLLPHYSAELYGLKRFMIAFADKAKAFGVRCELFTDERLL